MRNSDCVKKKRGLTGSNTNESSWVSVVNVPRKRSILRAAFEMNRLRRWAPCLLTRSATSAQKTFALHRNFVIRCAPTSSPAWHFSHYATLLNYLDNPFHHLQLNWFVGAVIIFFFFFSKLVRFDKIAAALVALLSGNSVKSQWCWQRRRYLFDVPN